MLHSLSNIRSPHAVPTISHTSLPATPAAGNPSASHSSQLKQPFLRKAFPDGQGQAPRPLLKSLQASSTFHSWNLTTDCDFYLLSHLLSVSVSHLLVKSHEEGGECVLSYSLQLHPAFYHVVESKYLFSDTFFHLSVICPFGPKGCDGSAVMGLSVLHDPLFFLSTLLTPPQITLMLVCHLFPDRTLTSTGKINA